MDIARTSAVLFTGKIVGAAVQFFGIVYFARELGASPIGVFFLFQALVGIFSVVADFGLRGAIEKRISEADSPQTFFTSGIVLKIIPLAIVAVVIIVSRSIINSYLGISAALLVVLAIIIHELAFLSNEVLRGELRVDETATIQVLQRLTWVSVGVLLLYYDFGIYSLVYSYILSFAVMCIIGWYKVSIPITAPSVDHSRSIIKYARHNFVESIGGISYNWLGVIMVGFFLTSSHVGAYEVVWRISSILMMVTGTVGTVLFPQVSRWHAENKKSHIASAIGNVITPSLGLVIPAFVGTALLSEEIIGIVFDEGYVIASAALVVLMGEKVFRTGHDIFGQTLEGIDRPRLTAVAALIFVSTNLPLNLLLIPNFGLVGCAVATAGSSTFSASFQYINVAKVINIDYHIYQIGWCLASATVMGVLIIVIQSIITINSMAQLLLIILTSVISYLTLVLLHKPIRTNVMNGIKTRVW